jgi:hypothetical protein
MPHLQMRPCATISPVAVATILVSEVQSMNAKITVSKLEIKPTDVAEKLGILQRISGTSQLM